MMLSLLLVRSSLSCSVPGLMNGVWMVQILSLFCHGCVVLVYGGCLVQVSSDIINVSYKYNRVITAINNLNIFRFSPDKFGDRSWIDVTCVAN